MTDFTRLLEWIDGEMDLDEGVAFAEQERVDPRQVVLAQFRGLIQGERIRLGRSSRAGQLDAFESWVNNERYLDTKIKRKIEKVETSNEQYVLKEIGKFRKAKDIQELELLQEEAVSRAQSTGSEVDDSAVIAAAQEERERIERLQEFVESRVSEAVEELNEINPDRQFDLDTVKEGQNVPASTPQKLREVFKNYRQFLRTGSFGGIRDI